MKRSVKVTENSNTPTYCTYVLKRTLTTHCLCMLRVCGVAALLFAQSQRACYALAASPRYSRIDKHSTGALVHQDLLLVARLLTQTYAEFSSEDVAPWVEDTLYKLNFNSVCFKAELEAASSAGGTGTGGTGGNIVGFVEIANMSSGWAVIQELVVDENHRRAGIASELVRSTDPVRL